MFLYLTASEQTYVEGYVLNRINEAVDLTKFLKILMLKSLQVELETVNQLLETIQVSKQKYLDLYETNLIDQEMFKGRIKEFNDEMDKLMLRSDEIEEILQGCN